MKTQRIILAVTAMLLLAGCHHGKIETEVKTEQDIRFSPGAYVMDEPESVNAYLEELCQKYGAIVSVHSSDKKDSLEIWEAVKSLDDYASGRRKYYPADEVRQALDDLAYNLGYWYSHGDAEDTNYAEIFFFRFLEQAVRFSPEVDYVTDFHCADGTAGILNYNEWSPNPLYSFLVYPTSNSLRVRMVGETGKTKIEKLFRLTDDAGREYYLCSNNGRLDEEDYYNSLAFCQFLFMRDGNELKEVASFDGNDFTANWDDGKVAFNPRLLRWDCCQKSGDTYLRIDGTTSILLKLDGENSRFEVEQ